MLRHVDGRATGEGYIAFIQQKTLASEMNGNQRGRAGSVQRIARPAQVKLVSDPRGHAREIVAECDLESIERLEELLVSEKIE